MMKIKIYGMSVQAGMVLLTLLSGCTSMSRDPLSEAKTPVLKNIEKSADVVGLSSQQDLNIEFDSMYVSSPLVEGDKLPDVTVKTFSIGVSTIPEIMKMILKDTNLTFTIDQDDPASSIVRRQMSATHMSGSLKKVLDTFSNGAGFFYEYREGVLHITPDRQFIAKVPPINNLFESIPLTFQSLGATGVFLDKSTRTIIYRASMPVQSKVSNYLKWVRDNTSMIVYETYIAEVILNDSINTGIQWNKFNWTDSAGKTNLNVAGGSSLAAGSLGVGALYTGTNMSVDMLASFLKTQGTVNQVSKIPMMLMSGGSAYFRSGNTDYYISSMSQPTVGTNGSVINGSAMTTPLTTGIEIVLNGDVYDNTVKTYVSLKMDSLIGYRPFPNGSANFEAPMTTDRAVKTETRVKDGDTILIAGINSEKYAENSSGFPWFGNWTAFPTSRGRSAHKTELVIVMRPKVIRFNHAPEAVVQTAQEVK